MIKLLKAKIHGAKVTDAILEYEGSIGIDQDFLDMAGLRVFEKVEIYNITNGNRFSTYIISGTRGSKMISLNGAAARLVRKGDKVIIAAYTWLTGKEADVFKPRILLMDEDNNPALRKI
jgi:aspartate 1-decarboxylase